jgi:hypothetical protein
MANKKTRKRHFTEMTWCFLELSKFTKNKDELTTIVDRWAYFLKYAKEIDEAEIERLAGGHEILKKAYEELKMHNRSPIGSPSSND